MKGIVGQGFAVALAGAVLFGTVYSSMVGVDANVAEIKGNGERPWQFWSTVLGLRLRFVL